MGGQSPRDNFAVADQIIQLSARAAMPGDMSPLADEQQHHLGSDGPDLRFFQLLAPVSIGCVERHRPSPRTRATLRRASVRVEMYVNSASDGSTSGTWELKGAAETGGTAVFNWNTTGLEGTYQIAFAMQDNAGDWNRWDSPRLPTLTYRDLRRPCYSLTKTSAQRATAPSMPARLPTAVAALATLQAPWCN